MNLFNRLFKTGQQSAGFCEDNWHLDIQLERSEQKLLSADFPLALEIAEWIDNKRSKIDRDYHDISWLEYSKEPAENGLFIAFMRAELFKDCFGKIGRAPEPLCRRKIKIVLQKHDDPNDRKSHPEWGCWLEVTAAEFLGWDPESKEEKASWR
jgi:hypothetical protein